MTTAEQLMTDENFLKKRLKEQEDYIVNILTKVQRKQMNVDRFLELRASAEHQRDVFTMALMGIRYSGRRDGLRYWFKPLPFKLEGLFIPKTKL